MGRVSCITSAETGIIGRHRLRRITMPTTWISTARVIKMSTIFVRTVFRCVASRNREQGASGRSLRENAIERCEKGGPPARGGFGPSDPTGRNFSTCSLALRNIRPRARPPAPAHAVAALRGRRFYESQLALPHQARPGSPDGGRRHPLRREVPLGTRRLEFAQTSPRAATRFWTKTASGHHISQPNELWPRAWAEFSPWRPVASPRDGSATFAPLICARAGDGPKNCSTQ